MTVQATLDSLWTTILAAAKVQIDPGLIHSFHIGIGLGLVLLTTLILFPGRETTAKQEKGPEEKASAKLTTDKGTKNSNDNNDDSSNKQPTPLLQDDFVSKYSFPSRQSEGWTPHRQLNTAVYLILFGVTGAILNNQYGGFVTVWLRMYFPKEAATLGF